MHAAYYMFTGLPSFFKPYEEEDACMLLPTTCLPVFPHSWIHAI
jgi:hypothetical protein